MDTVQAFQIFILHESLKTFFQTFQKHFLNSFKDFYVAFECNLQYLHLISLKFGTFTQPNIFSCLLRSQKEIMKHKCVTKPFSQKERWMPNLRQQRTNLFSANQWESFLSWGLFVKTILQVVPENGLLICTSNLQVHCQFYKWNFKCSYKCSLSNSKFNSKI